MFKDNEDFDITNWKKLSSKIRKSNSEHSCFLAISDAFNYLESFQGKHVVQSAGAICAVFYALNLFEDVKKICV
jgi:hypothetical protein